MKIKQIKKNTSWIRGGTNTGVYLFEDNTALIIDTGYAGTRSDILIKAFEENKIDVKYIINTHEHYDHCGANYEIRKHFKNIEIMASEGARVYLNNPRLYSDYLFGGKSPQKVFDVLKKEYVEKTYVDKCICPGILKIKGHNFEIIDLPGHTENCIGVVTDDKVLFLGDVLITENSLNKHKFLFMNDVKAQFETLDKLRSIDFEIAILGHSRWTFTKEQLLKLVTKNIQILDTEIEVTLTTLEKGEATYEEILKNLIIENNLPKDIENYFFYKNAFKGIISYLLDRDVIQCYLDDSMLKYRLKI